MSTILKALRRLEEDERSQAPRSLDEAVIDRPDPDRSRNRIGTIALAGSAAVVGLLAIAWSLSGFWSHPPEDWAEPVPPVVLVEAPKPPLPPAPVEKISPARSPQQAIEAFEDPEAIRREIQRLVGGQIALRHESEPAPPDLPAPEAAVQAVQKPAAPKPVVEEPKSSPVPARVPVEPAAEAPVSKPAPELPAAMPPPAPAPLIAVQEIVWHPNPARRKAVLKADGAPAQQLGEGDEIAGFVVVEIGLSEIELSQDGVSLKRRIEPN
jgi:hypothetical protein